ncbi:hypothetical protein HNY73_008358 [Argiope bruennichi]|uniref:Uncharacterized protein n=1 Tax=Argiope bruennichi TaxID=94029 RepID=A0A8T0F8G4_ARGBR|nr:hypothetical protein HNY73_008358 [Argiope bruennichi]
MKFSPTLFLLISPLFTSIFCRLRTFEQETKKETSVLIQPNLPENANFTVNHETRKVIRTYHHIVKKILPDYDYDAKRKHTVDSVIKIREFDGNRKINIVLSEDEKKIKQPFYPAERSNRFARYASISKVFPKFEDEGQNPETSHQRVSRENIDNRSKSLSSPNNRIQIAYIKENIKPVTVSINGYNISRQNQKVNTFNKKSVNPIPLEPSTQKEIWNFKNSPFIKSINQKNVPNLENSIHLASSTQKETKDFGNSTELMLPTQNKISESTILPFSSTQDKNQNIGTTIFPIISTRRTIKIQKAITSTISSAQVHESQQNSTQKPDSFKVKRDDQETNIISNLNLQSLIDAVQKELGTIASAEKKTKNIDEVKELIIINPDPKLKIVPKNENATESSKTQKDATTQKSLVVIWLISCAVLIKIIISIFVVYFIRLMKKRRKSEYKLLPNNNSEKRMGPTQIKRNASSEKVRNDELTLKCATDKCLKSCKIYRKDELEEIYSNPKHTEMLRNILEHRT